MMIDAITITESEFDKDILKWLSKAKECQVVVVDDEGNTKIVIGAGSLCIADDFDFEKYLSSLPDLKSNVDTTHNPWLD